MPQHPVEDPDVALEEAVDAGLPACPGPAQAARPRRSAPPSSISNDLTVADPFSGHPRPRARPGRWPA